MTYADGRATESLCSATRTFSHTIKQLLHQYHKYWLCPIFCVIDAITDNNCTIPAESEKMYLSWFSVKPKPLEYTVFAQINISGIYLKNLNFRGR